MHISAMESSDHAGTLATTISERLADRIRSDILLGRFAPGTRLKIADFAERHGLSHMPVREALRRLEGEGLVTIVPHRGATIRTVDVDFIHAIYDVREALEGILAERCAERRDEPGLARLQEAHDAFVDAAAGGDPGAILECNRRFHAVIVELAGNREAVRILESGRVLVEALRQTVGRSAGRLETIGREHAEIVDAIAQRDVERAGMLSRRHVAEARDDLVARLAAFRTGV